MSKTRSSGADLIGGLSFVGVRKDRRTSKFPRHFWCVKPTGDYAADWATGQRLGLEYLAVLERERIGILSWIIADMPRKKTGIEVGFLRMIEIAATVGGNNARATVAYWERCEAERQREEQERRSKRSRRAVAA